MRFSGCTLEDCLRAFSTKETLDGDNRPVCAHCHRRRKSSKCLAVHRFPPFLVIHLKRFHYDSASRKKLSTEVDFPMSVLDLAPYSTSGARPSGDSIRVWDTVPGERGVADAAAAEDRGDVGISKLEQQQRRESAFRNSGDKRPVVVSPVYELYGVCNHMGGLEGGHYTAHCRSRSGGGGDGGVSGGGIGDGVWNTFDDARVSRVNAARVGGTSAYILFYRLVSPGRNNGVR